MLIELKEAPEAATKAALAKVATLAQWDALGLPVEGLRLVLPHRVYNLRTRGLSDKTKPTDLRRAAGIGRGMAHGDAGPHGSEYVRPKGWQSVSCRPACCRPR